VGGQRYKIYYERRGIFVREDDRNTAWFETRADSLYDLLRDLDTNCSIKWGVRYNSKDLFLFLVESGGKDVFDFEEQPLSTGISLALEFDRKALIDALTAKDDT
jgi:hypothetical protein